MDYFKFIFCFFCILISGIESTHQFAPKKEIDDKLPEPNLSIDYNPINKKWESGDASVSVIGNTPMSNIKGYLIPNKLDGIVFSGDSALKIDGDIDPGFKYTLDIFYLSPHVQLNKDKRGDVLISNDKDSHITVSNGRFGVFKDGKFTASSISVSQSAGWHRITVVCDQGSNKWYHDRKYKGTTTSISASISYIGGISNKKNSFGSAWSHFRLYKDAFTADQVADLKKKDAAEVKTLSATDHLRRKEEAARVTDIKSAVKLVLKHKDAGVKTSGHINSIHEHIDTTVATTRIARNTAVNQVGILSAHRNNIVNMANDIDDGVHDIKKMRKSQITMNKDDNSADKRLKQAVEYSERSRKEMNKRDDAKITRMITQEKLHHNRILDQMKRESQLVQNKDKLELKLNENEEEKDREEHERRMRSILFNRKERFERLKRSHIERMKQADDLQNSLREIIINAEKLRQESKNMANQHRIDALRHDDEQRMRKVHQLEEDKRRDIEADILEEEHQREKEQQIRRQRLEQEDMNYKRTLWRTQQWLLRQEKEIRDYREEKHRELQDQYSENLELRNAESSWRRAMLEKIKKLHEDSLRVQNIQRDLAFDHEEIVSDINARRHVDDIRNVAQCTKKFALECCSNKIKIIIKKPCPCHC